MKITVLRGGPSSEREISLISGKSVAVGLLDAGHDVYVADISPKDLSALKLPSDVVFPVLHGWFGESGELQEILEKRHIPFVGSGSKASKLGMNKVLAKQVWEKAGLPTPPWQLLKKGDELKISAPCVVKAIDAGSSIDVFVCKTRAKAMDAIKVLLKKHPSILVEKFINGPELTVGLLEEKALAPMRIIAKSKFFDFKAKYQSNQTQHLFDTGLPKKVLVQCQKLAEKANKALGAIDLGRIDIMLDEKLNPWLLEINTIPGFTPKSLLPEAANHAGIGFSALVDRLARRAFKRGAR